MTTTTRLTAAATVLAVLAITAGCRDEFDPPLPQTAQSSATPTTGPSSDTTPGKASTTTPAPATTSLTPKEQAEAKAETAYRAWVKNYAAAAAAGFNPKKLESRLATAPLINYVTKQFSTFQTPGGTGRYGQQILRMTPARYVKGKTVDFRMCAIVDLRFLQDGKDVTITPEGAPSPVETEPKQYTVGVQSTDGGKTWKSSTIIYPSSNKNGSPSCSG